MTLPLRHAPAPRASSVLIGCEESGVMRRAGLRYLSVCSGIEVHNV